MAASSLVVQNTQPYPNMTPAFLMCARNKLALVRQNAPKLLSQDTSWSLKVYLVDHWSEDGTYELMQELASSYEGPHNVEVMRCPHADRTGIIGLNTILDWSVRRIEEDVIFFSSADDEQYPMRVERVMRVFSEHPEMDYVASRCRHIINGQVHPPGFDVTESGMFEFKDVLSSQIGFQTGGAWKRDLWLRYGPMRGLEAPDLILPCLAALQGKFYLLNECLHDSIMVADPLGVSVERAMQAAENTDEFLPLTETNQFQFCSSHFSLMRRLREMNVELDTESSNAILGKLCQSADRWVQWRDRLAISRVRPALMRV